MNPENLARVCDNNINTYLNGGWAEAYQFTPEQKKRIRARLEELKKKQIRYSLKTAAERHELTVQLFEASKGPGSQPSQDVERLRARLGEMNRGNVIFHWETALSEIERMLPEEQVKAGRDRLKERRTVGMERWREKERLRMRLREMDAREGVLRMLGTNGWEDYVDRFCMAFDLNQQQKATAASSLREAIARREEYRLKNGAGFDDIRVGFVEGHNDLLAGVESIFEQMKAGLDGIPTGVQVESARGRRPGLVTATRPTDFVSAQFVSTRPATSRPVSTRPVPAESRPGG